MTVPVFREYWRIPGTDILVYGAPSHTPEVVQFLWQASGGEVAGERIYRHVAGAAQLMTYVDDEGTVGWVWDPLAEPDPTALAVLRFVDGLTLPVMLAFVRESAAAETRQAVDAVAHGERELNAARRWLAEDQLMEVALSFDQVDRLRLALGMLPTWAGTAEEFRAAVVDVFAEKSNPS